MKIIKGIITILLVSVLIVSCKETKKEETTEAIDSTETVDKKSDEKMEVKSEEKTSFSYSVNYPKDTKLAGEVNATMKKILDSYPELEADFAKAYGYVVFPKITKAGLGIGGAGGKGLVFSNNNVIGMSKLIQATLGFQAGGQQYTQVLFFENKEAINRFTNGKFKFSTEASAVILESGASTNITYHDGVATVIESEKGAMFEASLGTQKFKYDGEM